VKEVLISVLLRHGDIDAMLKLSARATMLRLFGIDDSPSAPIPGAAAIILTGNVAVVAVSSEVTAISQHAIPSSFGEA